MGEFLGRVAIIEQALIYNDEWCGNAPVEADNSFALSSGSFVVFPILTILPYDGFIIT